MPASTQPLSQWAFSRLLHLLTTLVARHYCTVQSTDITLHAEDMSPPWISYFVLHAPYTTPSSPVAHAQGTSTVPATVSRPVFAHCQGSKQYLVPEAVPFWWLSLETPPSAIRANLP